jgi:hypothetical protein
MFSICFCTIGKPEFFTLETAFGLSDFLFTATAMRPDGKRPSMECLVSCYFATFGEFAKAIQNDQSTTLEQLVKASSKWPHIWKESISNRDSDSNRIGGSTPSTLEVPSDLASNRKLINSLTNVFENRLSKFRKSFKGGGGGNKGSGKNGGGGGGGKKWDNNYNNDDKWDNNGAGKRKLGDASWSESGNDSGANKSVVPNGGSKDGKEAGTRKRFNRSAKGRKA